MKFNNSTLFGLFIGAAAMFTGRDALAQAKAKSDTTVKVKGGSSLTLPKDMLVPGHDLSVKTAVESGRQVYWLTQILPNPDNELLPKQRVEMIVHGQKGHTTWNDLESLTVHGKQKNGARRLDYIQYIDGKPSGANSLDASGIMQSMSENDFSKKIKAEIFKGPRAKP